MHATLVIQPVHTRSARLWTPTYFYSQVKGEGETQE